MKTVLKVLLGLVVLFAVTASGVYGWAAMKKRSTLARTISTHSVDFPIPFPLADEEVELLREERAAAGADGMDLDEDELAALALERAIERGRHLVGARYGCADCHGGDFGGGVMIDDPMIGHIPGPNITGGEGGKTAGYGPADWDRIVRHGVKPDGTPATMPSGDFMRMSDQELSDIVAYIGSQPPVNVSVPAPKLGPLGTVLLAFGAIPLSADVIPEHDGAHAVVPPPADVSVEFGEHLAAVCTGCHGSDLNGGKVPGGDPSWPPAANLTAHADGLEGWAYEQFASTMRTGRRPDGTELREPMSLVASYAQRMSDVEMEALWTYLRSIPAHPTPR